MPFFELDRVKMILEISGNDDDALLTKLGNGAAETFKNFLLTKNDTLPFGDEITEDMRNAVAYKTATRFHLARNNYEVANAWKAEYEDVIEGIRQGLEEGQDWEYDVVEKF